jgi:radical SAM superfamily enzyme YgiQ (UPF0313 family)
MSPRPEIILTADRTLMSNYHQREFLGFAASAPPNVVPDWFFETLFFPPIKTRDDVPVEAPYGLRKIEAQLMKEGFHVLTLGPDHLRPYIEEAKVLGIHIMDPFGIGPASTTFSRILRTGDPYVSKYFLRLLEKPEVRKAKKKALRIIVGGPGAWQFRYNPEFLNLHGIDCVVDGEAEKVVGDIFNEALKGDELPQFYDVGIRHVPGVEDIPEIRNPSTNGLVEIGRGCIRGCDFCNVTTRPLRWYPYEKVEKEVVVNAAAGVSSTILHAEDVLLYGSKNTIPVREKVLELFRLSKKHTASVVPSHASIAAIVSDPRLVTQASEILLDEKQEMWAAQIGIETGSPQLLKKVMPRKAHPFEPEEWPLIVKKAAALMSDNKLVPAFTLITGLPQETQEDIIKTIELVQDLKDFKSLVVPLFFVPLGRLGSRNWFRVEEMNELHKQLLVKCLEHDIHWAKIIMRSYLRGKWYQPLLSPLYKLFIWLIERKAQSEAILD